MNHEDTEREYFQEFPTGKYPETRIGIEEWLKEKISSDEDDAVFPGWPNNLFSRKTSEVIQFIEERHRKTTDRKEYYCCLVHLQGSLAENERYLPFPERVKGKGAGCKIKRKDTERTVQKKESKGRFRGSMK